MPEPLRPQILPQRKVPRDQEQNEVKTMTAVPMDKIPVASDGRTSSAPASKDTRQPQPQPPAQTMEHEAAHEKRYHLLWLLSLAFAAASAGLAHWFGLEYDACAFFGLTVLAIGLWGFNLLHEGLVAVMLPIGYLLLGVGTPKEVLSSWTQPMGWLILGGLMTGLVLMHTGLARRIALWSLHIAGGSFVRLLWGLLLAGFIIAPLMPTALGKGILISIICMGICDALGFSPRSREASTLLIAGYIATSAPRLGLYTGGGEVTLGMQLLESVGMGTTWFDYFIQCYLPNVLYSVCSIAVLIFVMRPKTRADARAYVEEQYAKLGPMTHKEKKATLLFLVLVVLMMTDKYHGINTGWIMMLVGFASFLPGLNLVDSRKFASLNMTSVLFVVGCMSIGAGAQATGVDMMCAEAIKPLLNGTSELVTCVTSFVTGVVINFLLTPVAAVSTFTVPLAQIADSIGMSPLAPTYSLMYGLDQYVLPYEYAVFLYFFSTGYIHLKNLMLVFAVRALVALLLLVAVLYPWWCLTGAV